MDYGVFYDLLIINSKSEQEITFIYGILSSKALKTFRVEAKNKDRSGHWKHIFFCLALVHLHICH